VNILYQLSTSPDIPRSGHLMICLDDIDPEFDGNYARGGGAIYHEGYASVVAINCVFINNTALSGGDLCNGNIFTSSTQDHFVVFVICCWNLPGLT